MAHQLFDDALTMRSRDIDQQTALAVHSLLDDKNTQIQQDDGDVFQCGKCKLQYINLDSFIQHKRNGCNVVSLTFTTNPIEGKDAQCDSEQMEQNSFSNIVLSEELLSLATIDGQFQIINNSPVVSLSNNKLGSIQLVQMPNTIETNIEPESTSPPVYVIENNLQVEDQEQLMVEQHKQMKRRLQTNQFGGHNKYTLQNAKLSCQFCDKKFQKNFDLQQHLRCHTGEKPFQCLVCGRGFAQKSNVKKHMSTHKVWPEGIGKTLPKDPLMVKITEDNPALENDKIKEVSTIVSVDNSYVCRYCQEKFETFYQLRSHMIKHKDLQVFKCFIPECGQLFKNMEEFVEHTKSHDPDEITYNCQICSKQFLSLNCLAQHQYTHNSLSENKQAMPTSKSSQRFFQCVKCKSRYASSESLAHHMATTSHEFECPHCKKIFPCERYLRRHLPLHGNQDVFVCKICLKSFRTEAYLKIHSLIHSTVKPFKCDLCELRFVRKDHLKRHKITIHSAVKKYVCPFKIGLDCQKTFARQDKLKAHLLSHARKKAGLKNTVKLTKKSKAQQYGIIKNSFASTTNTTTTITTPSVKTPTDTISSINTDDNCNLRRSKRSIKVQRKTLPGEETEYQNIKVNKSNLKIRVADMDKEELETNYLLNINDKLHR